MPPFALKLTKQQNLRKSFYSSKTTTIILVVATYYDQQERIHLLISSSYLNPTFQGNIRSNGEGSQLFILERA